MQELRRQGIYDISRVQYAVLETDGTLNVMPCPDDKPVCARMLGIKADEEPYPSIVINNGHVLENNLRWLGFDTNWLNKQLRAEKISGVNKVYLMIADRLGRTYIAEKEKGKNA